MIKARSTLLQKVGGFLLQVADFLPIRLLDKQDAFRVLTQILNFAPQKIECARVSMTHFSTTSLQPLISNATARTCGSTTTMCRVVTLKEPPAQTFPHLFQALYEIPSISSWSASGSARAGQGPAGDSCQAPAHFNAGSASRITSPRPRRRPARMRRRRQRHRRGPGPRRVPHGADPPGSLTGSSTMTVVLYDQDPIAPRAQCRRVC